MDNNFFTNPDNNNRHRITQAEKNKDDKQWYKDMANLLDNHAFHSTHFISYGGISEFKRKKVNYDLFNNIINNNDFSYVCKPFGAEAGELPANLTNRDIVSGKIKVLLGMEMKMPFDWKIVAVNENATTRKEQEETKRIRDFVIGEIMKPIKLDIQKQILEQNKGKKLNPEEKSQLQQQIDQEVQTQTPEEVKEYMQRKHQDPAELLAHQIIEYLIQEQTVPDKFNKGFKHLLLSGEEVYQVGIFNGQPGIKVTNPIRFDYGRSPDSDLIEDAEWHVNELRMTASEVVKAFADELTDTQIDRIYSYSNNPSMTSYSDWTFNTESNHEAYTLRVLHLAFTSLRKVGFLTYIDTNGDYQEDIVDENYKLNKQAGDVKIDWDWIPEKHEVYKILSDIYVGAGPIPGQFKDMDNLYNCKGPYYGAAIDNLNSPTTAPMDRMKAYQYYYNIILYRIELLMASDKGKILAMNINAIPKSAGIDTAKFQYFMEANKIAYFNPKEEGKRGEAGGDVNSILKTLDMSLASEINQYIEFAEYIERKCGETIGVTKQMEGSIGPNEAVSNTRQNLVQSSHIVQPFFQLHNTVKKNVLQAVIETAKVAYSRSKPRKLSYVLDDMSYRMLTIDPELLDDSTYGLFMSNATKAADAKQAILQLGQAAMQNQQATLSDIIKVIRSESVTEAGELLETSEQTRAEQAQQAEQAKLKSQDDLAAKAQEFEREKWQHEDDLAVLKEKERRKTVIQQQAILSIGFDTNKDEDNDGVPDVLEVAKFGVDADIKRRKVDIEGEHLQLEKDKLDHQKQNDKAKNIIETKKLNKPSSGGK